MIQHWQDTVGKWIHNRHGVTYFVLTDLGRDKSKHQIFELIRLPSAKRFPPSWDKSWAMGAKKDYNFYDAYEEDMRLAIKVVFT
jgi:hypothetical protein